MGSWRSRSKGRMMRQDLKNNKLLALLVALAAFASGTTICLTLEEDGTVKITRQAPQLPTGTQLDADQEKEPHEQKESGAEPAPLDGEPTSTPSLENVGPDIHEDAVDETPPGITRSMADDALVTPPNPLPNAIEYTPLPQGGANDYNCAENFVRNHSPRATGVKVSQFVLHFTVSPPGSLRGIWSMFNNPASGASSHILLELDGECEYIVPWDRKAWTAGAFNSASEQAEIVTNNLTRNEWKASPIIRDAILARIVASRLKARGLPARRVDPEGCTPQAGLTDHDALECGNNHWDVGPNFPWGELMRDVKQIYKHGTLCDAKCRRIARREAAHKKTHKHYRRHARRGECRKGPHRTKPREYTKKHCRNLKLKIKRQHAGIRRAKRS